ncbi:MAG: type I polyketide synthase [Egibacteraceae bacterium]
MSQRRSFRQIPPERMRAEDYFSADPRTPDKTYAWQAAVLEGYEFDRSRFRVPGSTFRTTDMSHWLALDVTNDALTDAGFPNGEGLPKESTGVIVGNTLTGDFTRALDLRFRWPYVRRVARAELEAGGIASAQVSELLGLMERSFKAPFPPVDEDTLAGGLANTIAGRICNFFDLQGGGYIVDGACSSSLLALATACGLLVAGDVDVAVAGGVDLSIDPFEVVGFAKAGALAHGTMRVYDRRGSGFWPGEGCGMVVLMRAEDAAAQHKDPYAVIRGWGISSDGAGGMTRPKVDGQKLALRRAHRRAGVDIDSVRYIEGHGTGTQVGDAVELQALSEFRREAGATVPAAVGSIKANIGHTKAAAGVAGMIKAVMAVRTGIVPPNTACEQPHPLIEDGGGVLAVLPEARGWPGDKLPAAAVSGAGFGGINTHLILEQASATHASGVTAGRARALLATPQDAEVFLLAAPARGDLVAMARHVGERAAGVSLGDLRDLAAALAGQRSASAWRLGVVASTPRELVERLDEAAKLLDDGGEAHLDADRGVFVGHGEARANIGFLFPGQGSPASRDGGAWHRRFAAVAQLYQHANLPGGDAVATQVAQPVIATASAAGLAVLDALGIEARVAVGHSLGELCAYHWAGAFGASELVELAKARGQAMASGSDSAAGAMASVFADFVTTLELLNGTGAVVAGVNASRQVVISGAADAVTSVLRKADEAGIRTVRLPVSHAFHSPLMAGAAALLDDHLDHLRLAPLAKTIVSTVTGEVLTGDADLRELLLSQLTTLVRFADAAAVAAKEADVFFEVGPGNVLSGLVSELAPVIPLDVGGQSLRGLLCGVAAAHALGVPVRTTTLFEDRVIKRFDLDRPRRFLTSPCELVPADGGEDLTGPKEAASSDPATEAPAAGEVTLERIMELVRALVAQRAELHESAVGDDDRLLGDLHLSSVTVGQIAQEAMRQLSLPAAAAPTSFAGATVRELARALEELATTQGARTSPAREFDGVGPWVRPFTVALEPQSLQHAGPQAGAGEWVVLSPPGHPLAGVLEERLKGGPGTRGFAVCLSPRRDAADLRLLLRCANRALASDDTTHVLVVQHGGGGSAFARTLFLEAEHINVCVVDVGYDQAAGAADTIVAEVAAADGFVEAHYSADGHRRSPVLRPLAAAPVGSAPDVLSGLGPADVLLVTGGGKGIAAECALALGQATGVRLALVGRSRSGDDPELDANLARMRAAGVQVAYASGDLTDPSRTEAAIAALQQALGPITAVLHGAGMNIPCLIRELDEERVLATLKPKVHGLQHVLAALDSRAPAGLRLLIAFGSLIARAGMRGEGDYGLANEWMALEVERFAGAHPGCRCLTLEWSAWSGVGIVERLGRVEALTREGIDCMPVDLAVDAMMRLLARSDVNGSIVLTGRVRQGPTVTFPHSDLELLRFLEQPRVQYPGIELVVDTTVRADKDLYLQDHVMDGNAIFPAVFALEAMSQAATAVRADGLPLTHFERVEFLHPVVAPEAEDCVIRTASLAVNGCIDVVLRSGTTNFLTDHMRASCAFDGTAGSPPPSMDRARAAGAAASIDVREDLYHRLLFQSGRFQRIRRYRSASATFCLAEVEVKQQAWFSAFLPGQLLLGDPGVHDAALHCIQVAAPHLPLLPVSVARLDRFKSPSGDLALVICEERARAATEFVWDIDICTPDGELCERWSQVRYRLAATPRSTGEIPNSLLGVMLERRLQDILSRLDLRAALEFGRDGAERRDRSDGALRRLLGEDAVVTRRVDGRPEVAHGRASTAHAADATLAVVITDGVTACDLELVDRCTDEEWRDVLGPMRWELAEAVARAAGFGGKDAGALVWAAGECIVKAGLSPATALSIRSTEADGWISLVAGDHVITSTVLRGGPARADLAVGVLVDRS